MDSICSQTYKNLEIILIDDGSTDESGEICDSYAEKDPRISVVHQSNSGTVAARQRGLAETKGKYVGFVDADDWIDPEMFKYMVSKMQETKADLVQIQMYDWKTETTGCETIEFQKTDLAEMLKKEIFIEGSLMPNLFSKLFYTEKLKDAFSRVPVKQQFGEDLLCLLHYLNASSKLCLSDREFYHYEILEGSVSRKSWVKMSTETAALYSEIKKVLEDYGQWGVCKEGVVSYYQTLLMGYVKDGFQDTNVVERYRFPNIADLMEKKVILYGAGKVGTDYYKQIVGNEKQQIVAWIDRNPVGSAVQSPDCLKRLEYDSILLAVAKEEVANEIREELLGSGLCNDPQKIIWQKPERLW